MPFYRFEDMESIAITPHLSSAKAPVIEGDYLYFCLNQKEPGTGSELHYHPNELLIYCVRGKINAVVGKDRRVGSTGTFILVPPYARHSMRATEDGPCAYLYIKDQTWSVVGIAADEGVPDQALTIEESAELHRQGKQHSGTGKGESKAIIEGIRNCYHPILPSLDEPVGEGRRTYAVEGHRSAFSVTEQSDGIDLADESAHERFIYVITGTMDASIGNEERSVSPGSVLHIPKGTRYSLRAEPGTAVRYATAWPLPQLVTLVDEKVPV